MEPFFFGPRRQQRADSGADVGGHAKDEIGEGAEWMMRNTSTEMENGVSWDEVLTGIKHQLFLVLNSSVDEIQQLCNITTVNH